MLRLALVLLVASAATAQPVLHTFSISDGTVEGPGLVFDLADGTADLLFTVAARSPQADVSSISISMGTQPSFTDNVLLTAPPLAGAAGTVRVTLPRFLAVGTYRLNVAVLDSDGHSRRWTADELAAEGLPHQFEVRVTGDPDGPLVSNVQIAPLPDPSRPQGEAQFTFQDRSGITAYRVIVVSPSGRRHVLADYRSGIGVGPSHTFAVPFDLSTGPTRSGPAEAGRWSIAEIRATDSNGTSQVLTGRDLFNLNIQSTFAVGDVPPDEVAGPGCGSPNPVPQGGTLRLPARTAVHDARGRRVGRSAEDGAFRTEGLSAGVYIARSPVPDIPTCRFTVVAR